MKTGTLLGITAGLLVATVATYTALVNSLPKPLTPEQIAAEQRAETANLLSLHDRAGSVFEELAVGEQLKIGLATEGEPVSYDLTFLGYDSTSSVRVAYEIKDSRGRTLSKDTANLGEFVTMCWEDTIFNDPTFVHPNQFEILNTNNPRSMGPSWKSAYSLGLHFFEMIGQETPYQEDDRIRIGVNNVAPVGIYFDDESQRTHDGEYIGYSRVPLERQLFADGRAIHVYKISGNGVEPVSQRSTPKGLNQTGGKK